VTQKLGQISKIRPDQIWILYPSLGIGDQLPAPSLNGVGDCFEGLVTLTLTLDRVILHTVVHHSSTSTYMSNFVEMAETFCGRRDVRSYARKDDGHLGPALLGRL